MGMWEARVCGGVCVNGGRGVFVCMSPDIHTSTPVLVRIINEESERKKGVGIRLGKIGGYIPSNTTGIGLDMSAVC